MLPSIASKASLRLVASFFNNFRISGLVGALKMTCICNTRNRNLIQLSQSLVDLRIYRYDYWTVAKVQG